MPHARIRFFDRSSFTALRASEPLTFSFSEMMEGVISFCFGTSASIFSYVVLSKSTRFASFSFTLPLDHFCETRRAKGCQHGRSTGHFVLYAQLCSGVTGGQTQRGGERATAAAEPVPI